MTIITTLTDHDRLTKIEDRLRRAADFANGLVQDLDSVLAGKTAVDPGDWIVLTALIDIPKRLLPNGSPDSLILYIANLEAKAKHTDELLTVLKEVDELLAGWGLNGRPLAHKHMSNHDYEDLRRVEQNIENAICNLEPGWNLEEQRP